MEHHGHLRSLPTNNQQPDKLLDAEVFAWCAHYGQERKLGENGPFATHPQGVMELLVEAGITDEDTLIAALLHDTVEMKKATLDIIAERYGQRVYDIVDGVTKREGFVRREDKLADYLRRLGEDAPLASVEVAMADKVNNIEDLIQNQRLRLNDAEATSEMWGMFKAGASGTLEWHRKVLAIGQQRLPDHPLTERLARGVETLEHLLLAAGAIKLSTIEA